MKFHRIAMVGLGSIGTVYGKMLLDTYGHNFKVIAGGERAERLRQGVHLNEEVIYPDVLDPGQEEWKADLVLFSVKNYHLSQAIKDSLGVIDRHTVLLPLLNGVTARDELLAAYPENEVLYGLAIGIDAVRENGKVISENPGRIQYGCAKNLTLSQTVAATKEVFDTASIPNEVCEDMVRTLWKKWMINVGINQVQAATGSDYADIRNTEYLHDIMQKAMYEVVNVAKAYHVNLIEKDVTDFETLLFTFPDHSKTSMLQDVQAKRKTEIDSFAGTVVKFGKEKGVPTPINETIYAFIRGIELNY
ncbi:MAG: 2-dehydropantoate 2-reductase [Clostridiales bacterium]|nr:2-dehydropantoate 2-reductase [Clostridiales bacterium]